MKSKCENIFAQNILTDWKCNNWGRSISETQKHVTCFRNVAINCIAEWSFSQWQYHICINSFYILYNSSDEMIQLYLL